MNTEIILILLLIAASKDSTSDSTNLLTLKNYTEDFKVDYKYTREKIKIFKNIMPYLPSDYIDSSGRSIIATEKVLKVLETVEFINAESTVPVKALEMDTVERAYKIVSTLQEEISNSNIDKLGTILDVAVNKDHYKQIVNLAMDFMTNKDNMNNPNNISKMLKLFLGEEEIEKNNLGKMLDILQLLDPEKKNTEQPNND